MILLDSKTTKASSNNSLVIPQDKDKKTTLSFSELLKGVSQADPKEQKDSKVVQNGVLVLNLSKDEDAKLAPKSETKSQKEDFSSLLKNPQKEDEKEAQKKDIKTNTQKVVQKEIQVLQNVVVNPQVTQNMTPKELKALIVDAKKYLKDQIVQSDGYKKAQIKEMPKTLKGLVEVAKKFKIDVTKISLENVKENSQAVKKTNIEPKQYIKSEQKVEVKTESKSESKQEIKPEIKQELKTDVKSEVKPEVKTEIKTQTKQDVKVEPKLDAKADVKQEVKPEVKTEIKTQTKQDVKVEPKLDAKADVRKEVKPEVKTEIKTQTKQDVKVELKLEEKQEIKHETKHEARAQTKSDVIHTPLFKAQKANVTTEQTLQAREFKLSDQSNPLRKSAKQRADDTLKLLLRGEKPQKLDTTGINITSDFSVATAKVIAPSANKQAQNSLELLLRGESSETSITKQENIISTPKADSFEVKINEAKQMTKFLSQDVKQAIDNYKSPFTRLRVQLNPQNLGEVDLTVVQRGKNIHVNISSNNVAINALAMNANDLKVQLNNTGIQNATLNFNSGSSDGANQQQQQHRQNQQASREYNYFDNEEQNEEVLSSLEIVVPNYA